MKPLIIIKQQGILLQCQRIHIKKKLQYILHLCRIPILLHSMERVNQLTNEQRNYIRQFIRYYRTNPSCTFSDWSFIDDIYMRDYYRDKDRDYINDILQRHPLKQKNKKSDD